MSGQKWYRCVNCDKIEFRQIRKNSRCSCGCLWKDKGVLLEYQVGSKK